MDEQRQQKLIYIMTHASENGFDTTKFNRFLTEQYSGQKQIDTMSFEQIVAVVSEFKKFRDKSQPQSLKKSRSDVYDKTDESVFQKMQKKKTKDKEKPFIRKSQITKELSGLNKTDLNQRLVNLEITRSDIVKAGIFSSDYVEFTISCEIPSLNQKHVVQRKDADFYHLRQVLSQQFPYMLIPPLPLIKETKCAEKEMNSRQQMYNRFLTSINRSEVLKSCRFLQQFLTITDKKYFEIERKGHEKIKFSRKIEDVVSPTGQVSVEDRTDSKKFCGDSRTFSGVYKHIINEATMLSKEVHEMSENLATSIGKLSMCVRDLGKLFRKIKVNSQYKLFQKLSMLFKDQSRIVGQQGYLTKVYLGQAMKYYDQEYEPLEELVSFRDQFNLDYQKEFTSLEERKHKLFKKDPKQWGYTQGTMDELQTKIFDLMKNKQQAFRYMLSQETQKVQEMGEELSFYTNQCLDEVHRVSKDNGVALIDHFMDHGQLQCDYLQEQHNKWSDFVSYFGSLAWDDEEQEKQKRRRMRAEKQDDFEMIDDSDELDQSIISVAGDTSNYTKTNTQQQQNLKNKGLDDGFELVSAQNNSNMVRVSHINFEEQLESTDQSNNRLDAALSKLLQNESIVKYADDSEIEDQLPEFAKQEPSSTKEPSQIASTDQTLTSEKSLLAAPTVVINKKKKDSQSRKTAPLNDLQRVQPRKSKQQATGSTQLQSSKPISDGQSPTEQLTNEENKTNELISFQSSQSADHRKSGKSNKSGFAFETQQQHTSQSIIFEESEKNSSEDQTMRNDTIVMDLLNQSQMPHGDLLDLSRIQTSQKQQTSFTQQNRTVIEPEPLEELKLNAKPGSLQAQLLEAQSRMKQTQQSKQQSTVRQSILTRDQIDKLQMSQRSGFIGGLPKLKPVQVPTADQLKKQSSIMSQRQDEFNKQESAIQKAIRKIQEGNSSDDEDNIFS